MNIMAVMKMNKNHQLLRNQQQESLQLNRKKVLPRILVTQMMRNLLHLKLGLKWSESSDSDDNTSPLLLLKICRDGGLRVDSSLKLLVRSSKTAQNYDKEVSASAPVWRSFRIATILIRTRNLQIKKKQLEFMFFVKNISIFSSSFSSFFLHRIKNVFFFRFSHISSKVNEAEIAFSVLRWGSGSISFLTWPVGEE